MMEKAQRFLWTINEHGRPYAAAVRIAGLTLLLLILGACGERGDVAPVGASITFEELPAGLGRGFPGVTLAGVENGDTGLESGDRAPNFRLELADGSHISLNDLQGRPVMLNFWATWCPPCREEMPDIVAAYEADDELVVLAVNVREELDAVEPFTEDFHISMPVVMDTQGELSELYGVRGMPTSVFIGRDGAVVTKWPGILSGDALTAMLSAIP